MPNVMVVENAPIGENSVAIGDRLALLASIVDGAELIGIVCLDHQFNPAPIPRELVAMGLAERLVVDRVRHLQAVDSAWHAKIAGAIGHAMASGIGGCRVGLTAANRSGNVETVGCRVVDFGGSHGVIVVLIGEFVDELDDGTPPLNKDLRPRMLVQRSDESGHYLRVDPNTAAILGWTPDEMLGRSGLTFVHADDHEIAVAAWLRVLGGEDGSRQRLRFRRKLATDGPAAGAQSDGDEWYWLEATYTNHLHEQDPYIRVELLDVKGEMDALAELRSIANRYETLAESLPVGVSQFDTRGMVVYANKWLRDIVKLISGSDDPQAAMQCLHPDDRETMRDGLRKALAGEEVTIELRAVNEETYETWFLRVSIRPLCEDGLVVGAIASTIDITARMSLEDRLRIQANTDYLTGLPNRAALTECLQSLLAAGQEDVRPFACLFADLDDFKLVNDAMGHDAGDTLLVTIAERLQSAVRPTDTVARVGGDEFVVICEGPRSAEDVVAVAQRLMERVHEPVLLANQYTNVSISLGIAIYDGTEIAADVLISNADLAMYEAKRAGGSRWKIYGESMRESMHARFDSHRSMHDAMERNEFCMHLQPIFDLETGEVTCAEALIRWRHPERGLMAPGYFMEFLTESDMMIPMGWWIIEDCCRIAARVVASGSPEFRLGINVTGAQLAEVGFADRFLRTVAAHGLLPSNLVIEVTETLLIEEGAEVSATLDRLNAAGTFIALDDFGTGFSSLNHVRDFPVKFLKIDRSYTSKMLSCPATRAIVDSVHDLATKLDLRVIVEGIETIEEREMLLEMGLSYGQGYLMARPCDEQSFLDHYAPYIAVAPLG